MQAALENKFLPPFGATISDMIGGQGEKSGYMDYNKEEGSDG